MYGPTTRPTRVMTAGAWRSRPPAGEPKWHAGGGGRGCNSPVPPTYIRLPYPYTWYKLSGGRRGRGGCSFPFPACLRLPHLHKRNAVDLPTGRAPLVGRLASCGGLNLWDQVGVGSGGGYRLYRRCTYAPTNVGVPKMFPSDTHRAMN